MIAPNRILKHEPIRRAVIALAFTIAFPSLLPVAAGAVEAQARSAPHQVAQAQPAAMAVEVLKSETTRIRGWVVNCVTMADETRTRRCAAKLTVMRAGSEGPVFVWEMVLNAQRSTISALQVPTGVLIEPGVEFRSMGVSVRRVKLLSCAPARCNAGFVTDETLVRELAAIPKLEAVVKDLVGGELVIPFDLSGIEEAYATLLRP